MKNNLTKIRQLNVLMNNGAGLSWSTGAFNKMLGALQAQALSLFFVLVATFAFQQNAQAQTGCSCNDFNLPLDANGEATVTPAMAVSNETDPDCDIANMGVRLVDEFDHRLRDFDGNLLPADQVRCNHVGEVIKTEVWYIDPVTSDSSMVCWSYVHVEDKMGPTCTIDSFTLECREYRNPYVKRVMEGTIAGASVAPGASYNQPIIVNGPSNPYGRVTHVSVRVRATVADLGKLRLQLKHPGGPLGTLVNLTNQDVICNGDGNIDATFDSDFPKYNCFGTISGNVGPMGDLNDFVGLDKQGVWRIRIQNYGVPGDPNFVFQLIELRVTYDYLPIVTDNCKENPTFSYEDEEHLLCNNKGYIHRTWTVTDPGGKTTVCDHGIGILLNNPPEIVWPKDTTFSCIVDIHDLDPEDLEIYNDPNPKNKCYYDKPHFVDSDNYCGNLAVSKSDEIYDICLPYGYKIRREWRIRDWCDPDFFEDSVQYIIVMDTEPPVITAPDSVMYTVQHNNCTLTVDLPEVDLNDNCDVAPTSKVRLYDHTTGAYHSRYNVPPGRYDAIYTARDACGNESWDTILVVIKDDIDPVPICDRNTNITLTNRGGGASYGWAEVCWQTIDDGSYDNCELDRILISKSGRDGTFRECLTYRCNDVGENYVYLRVWDKSGNYNTCWAYLYVQDKVAPDLTCEADTIYCTDDISRELDRIVASTEQDWESRGLIEDNCDSTTLVCTDFTYDGEDCYPSYSRECYAVDLYGNQSLTCTHTVFIQDTTPWKIVSWPPDMRDLACNTSTDPSRTGEPVVDYDCEHIGVRHQDEEFQLCGSGSGLVKIRRIWTITDWCTGIDSVHVQEIYQKDDVPPTLTIPDDFTADINTNTCLVTVRVDVSAVDDCGAPVEITNDLDNQHVTGSGPMVFTLPKGITEILFRAEDKCGNATVKGLKITVRDRKAPTARCSDITVNIKSTGVVTVPAILLDKGSDDNCTDQANLKFFIQKLDANGDPVGNQEDELLFNCDDVDSTHMVRLIVEDDSGNQSFCITTVRVTDTGNFCGSLRFATLGGVILTSDGSPVSGATVSAGINGVDDVKSSSTGRFMFPALEKDSDYKIQVEKDQPYIEGLSTLDLIYIKRHILRLQQFDNPYQMIAADANGDHRISALDMIQLRSLILRTQDELTAKAPWEFVDVSYVFPEESNPWLEEYPQYIMSGMLTGDNMSLEFVGVKIGDVDNSHVSPRSQDGLLSLSAQNKKYYAGDMVEFTISADQLEEYIGAQFTLRFNPKALQFEHFTAGIMGENSIGLNRADDGYLSFSWNSYESNKSEDQLFTLTFLAKQDADFAETLNLGSEITPSEAYDSDGNNYKVELNFDSKGSEVFELYQNVPNPFAQYTSIGFNLPNDDVVSLKIMDISGKLIYEDNAEFNKGFNEFKVNSSVLDAGGIYYYHVETSGATATKKMVYFRK